MFLGSWRAFATLGTVSRLFSGSWLSWGGGHAAQILFWGFLIVGLHWPTGFCWVRNIVLWLGRERSREGLDGVVGPRAVNWMNRIAVDDGISAEANDRFLVHIQGIDPPTLS